MKLPFVHGKKPTGSCEYEMLLKFKWIRISPGLPAMFVEVALVRPVWLPIVTVQLAAVTSNGLVQLMMSTVLTLLFGWLNRYSQPFTSIGVLTKPKAVHSL